MLSEIADKLFGKRVGDSTERHRPKWPPNHFDHRWLGERLAVMDLPPYKPPYRRHGRYKAWVCMGPNYAIRLNAIVEIDLDERTLDVDIYR